MLSLLRKALPFLAVATIFAIAYDGWFFYSRWRQARETERMIQANEIEEARKTVALMGGGKLTILNFYATPGVIRRGERANICYGVAGAKSVRIEPPIEDLNPAIAHCLQISPSTTTDYKLVAQDSAGHTVTREISLQVTP